MTSFSHRRGSCDPSPVGASHQAGGRLDHDLDRDVNVATLTGILVTEPQRDTSRRGDPITVILLCFTAPEDDAESSAACCEVEIPDVLADPQRRRLRAGRRISVSGKLTGAGGLWATSIDVREYRRLSG